MNRVKVVHDPRSTARRWWSAAARATAPISLPSGLLMEWVAIAVNIARDPAVHRLAAALRVRVPEVVGLLTLTFAEMSQHAPDGRVGDVPDTLLESWAGWHGKRSLFAIGFRAELCDQSGLVTAWEKYNGANIRRAKAARERTRAWRDRNDAKPSAGSAPHTGAGTHTATRTGTHTEGVSVCRTEQDSTEQDSTEPDYSLTEHGAGAKADAEVALRTAMGDQIGPIEQFLGARPARSRSSWYPEFLRIIGPSTGVTPADLAGACSDALLVDPPASTPVAVRAFAMRRRQERTRITTRITTVGRDAGASVDPFASDLNRWAQETDARESANLAEKSDLARTEAL
jgi:hypothetical protein